MTDPKPDPAERERYVFAKRPRCPICRSKSLKTLRSTRMDRSIARRTQCLRPDCGHKCFVIWE
jgi:hypothetical protein